jgi:hypothetical protein
MRVEADLFSGRPNPVWTLDAAEEGEVARLLRTLRPGGPSPRPPGLGYRGMMLRGLSAALPGCAELRLFHGAGVAECDGEHRTFTDPDRAVERWLAASGRRRLDAELFQVLHAELERDPGPHP